ncbi:hypothetical protein B0T16DRAFT_387997 [Cercophora newfieldiana]|uniref:Uncharacterized protein n=1 Tax=Cercophora newfieldiana TaxID=92897 RepID=A0AA39YI83_9PEZI|nr:hypothetical protein B0T16DRAFT_387997 [Cercophora newfieldiana]
MASITALRTVLAVSLVPGFGLLIAAGAVSHHVVPAIGLVPLFFSAVFSLALLNSSDYQQTGSARSSPIRPHAHANDGGESHLRPGPEEQSSTFEKRHPILVFLADVIFATSLMVVLVFTWISMSWSWRWGGSSTVLATYATMPLLTNFFIHAWLAIREFTVGTGLATLLNRIRFRGIPADCPSCGVNIRPATPPTPPWFDSVSAPSLTFRQVSFSVPAVVPSVLGQAKGAARDWKAPSWMKGAAASESAPLIANQEDAEASDAPYQDDYDEDAVTVRPSLEVAAAKQGGSTVEEVVVTKKDKKGKGTDDEPSW